MRSIPVFSLLLLVSCGLLPPTSVQAEPMFSSREEVSQAALVCIAKFRGADDDTPGNVILDMERCLRGPLTGQRLSVEPCGGTPFLHENERFVAFVSAERGLCHTARAPLGTRLEDAPLMLEGFYDVNAHLVEGALTSLPLIRAWLIDQPQVYRLRGPLWFADEQGNWAAAEDELSLQWTWGSEPAQASWTGLPASRFDGAEVGLRVSPGWGPHLTLSLNVPGERSLVLEGEVLRVAADGVLETRWRIEGVAREVDYRARLAGATRAQPWYELALRQPDGSHWTLELNQEPGRVGVLRTDSAVVELSGIGLAPERYIDAGRMRIELVPAASRRENLHWGTDAALVDELMTGPIECRIVEAGREDRLCRLELQAWHMEG